MYIPSAHSPAPSIDSLKQIKGLMPDESCTTSRPSGQMAALGSLGNPPTRTPGLSLFQTSVPSCCSSGNTDLVMSNCTSTVFSRMAWAPWGPHMTKLSPFATRQLLTPVCPFPATISPFLEPFQGLWGSQTPCLGNREVSVLSQDRARQAPGSCTTSALSTWIPPPSQTLGVCAHGRGVWENRSAVAAYQPGGYGVSGQRWWLQASQHVDSDEGAALLTGH